LSFEANGRLVLDSLGDSSQSVARITRNSFKISLRERLNDDVWIGDHDLRAPALSQTASGGNARGAHPPHGYILALSFDIGSCSY
jgi:hypothetical protein